MKPKLSTPAWILEGYDSLEAYNKAKGVKKKEKSEKTFKIRVCPKCKSNNVCVVLTGGLESEIPSGSSRGQAKEGKTTGEWECKKCKWIGTEINEKELTEEEFMKYLDEKGEEVA